MSEYITGIILRNLVYTAAQSVIDNNIEIDDSMQPKIEFDNNAITITFKKKNKE